MDILCSGFCLFVCRSVGCFFLILQFLMLLLHPAVIRLFYIKHFELSCMKCAIQINLPWLAYTTAMFAPIQGLITATSLWESSFTPTAIPFCNNSTGVQSLIKHQHVPIYVISDGCNSAIEVYTYLHNVTKTGILYIGLTNYCLHQIWPYLNLI